MNYELIGIIAVVACAGVWLLRKYINSAKSKSGGCGCGCSGGSGKGGSCESSKKL